VPAQPVVEVPLLELLADVVAGDVLRPLANRLRLPPASSNLLISVGLIYADLR